MTTVLWKDSGAFSNASAITANALQAKESLVAMIENYIRYYNFNRLQRNLGVLTPMQKHCLYKAA